MKKAVLITGASSGIGAATALEFSNQGYFVYLMGRNKDRLAEVASQCCSGASLLSCDLSDKSALDKRLSEALSNKIHHIEVVVNNAGIYANESIQESQDATWEEQMNVNLMVPVRICRAFIPYFKNLGRGSFVNVSSTLGLRPQGPTAAYSASKAALVNFTQSLALECGPLGIRANCVCPGIVDTPIHQGRDVKSLGSLQPLGRVGNPVDVAKSIYFLGSPDSAWTTGAVLSVDGGINLT